ncbi:MAG: hypothetical protein ACE5KM_24525, partial [Planctomycetaceae bacterium]
MNPLAAERESGATSAFRPQARAAFFIGLLYCLICLPPWIPEFLTAGDLRDPSWQYALHEAFAQNRQFGTEVVFTYGPYGFVTTRMYHPATYALMLAVWSALSVVFFAHTWRSARLFCTGPWGALLVSAIAVRVAAVNAMSFLLSFLVMFLLWRTSTRRSGDHALGRVAANEKSDVLTRRPLEFALQASLILVVGFLPLTKFTFVPATALVLAAVVVRDSLRRTIPIAPLLAVTAAAVLWGLSGQAWGGLGDYLATGFEAAKHYGAAMGLWESRTRDVAAVWLAAALVVLVPLLMRHGERDAGRLAGAVVPLTLAALLFLVWKFTFVRFHPLKVAVFFSSALLIALFLRLTHPSRGDGSTRRCRIGLSLPAVLLIATSVRVSEASWDAGDILWSHSQNPAAARAWLQGDEWMPERHRANCRAICDQHPLADVDGTIDVVPDKLEKCLEVGAHET